MISAKIADRPRFFVLLTAVVLFFIRRYAFFAADDFAEATVFSFDIGDFMTDETTASLVAAVLGTVYLFLVDKTAERIFGVKEGICAAVIAGCNIGSFILFHQSEPMSLLLVFSSGFTGVLMISAARPRALTSRHFAMFHVFFFLSCCVGILPSIGFLVLFYALTSHIGKSSPLRMWVNWRTLSLLVFDIGSVVFIRYFSVSGQSGYSFLFALLNDWRWYLKSLGAFFVLFVPGVFFVVPALPFVMAVIKKNTEFRILTAWTAAALFFGAAFGGWFGSLAAAFPLAITLSCVISNMALDGRRYFKSSAMAIAAPSLLIALFFMALARSNEVAVLPLLCYFAAFTVLYIAFSGVYNLFKLRYYQVCMYFAVGYSLLKIVLSLGI